MRALHAVILDFDGVIANSEGLHLRAYQDVLAGTGMSISDQAYFERYLGFDDVGVLRAVAADAGRPWPTTRWPASSPPRAGATRPWPAKAKCSFPAPPTSSGGPPARCRWRSRRER